MRKLNEEDPRHRLNHTVLNAIREDRDISKDSAKSCRGFISGPRSGGVWIKLCKGVYP